MNGRTILAVFIVIALAIALPATAAATTLVVAAPGYPSDTAEAQPTMDLLARGIERAVGWPEGRVNAIYHSDADDGLAALGEPGTGLAMVPLPLFLQQREALGLVPLLEVSEPTGDDGTWSLVARRDAIDGPESLAGWQVSGLPGYAPEFVRRIALAGWGTLPEGVEIRSTSRVLSVLRKAARGDSVAALLDGAQAASLQSLPFADDLEVVHRSDSMPSSLLCAVGGAVAGESRDALLAGLPKLAEVEGGDELLRTLRIAGFRPIRSHAQLEELIARFAAR